MEVIPGSLVFDPWKEGELEHVSAISLCAGEDGTLRGFHVTHYSNQACGEAFGPLDLEHTIRFCRSLEKQLDERRRLEKCLVLTTAPHDEAAYTNVVVLLGGYLILRLGWSVESVARLLGPAASARTFPCCWLRDPSEHSEDVMRVQHCWLGFQAARKHRWLVDAWFSDDSAAHLACSQYRSTVSTYDACWVIPEKILICADPVTTVIDPNPCTFKHIFGNSDTSCKAASQGQQEPHLGICGLDDFSEITLGISGPDRSQSSCSSFRGDCSFPVAKERHASDEMFEVLEAQTIIAPVMSPCSVRSTDTVCKEYITHTLQPGSSGFTEPLSFCEFLRENRVSIVVRANEIQERGMQCESYDERRINAYGIDHLDLPFPDYDGSLPPYSVCAALLKSMQKYIESDDAICIHCKGGFGRSAVLACVLAVHHYDVSGEAMLGWIRIARPGAITTPQQEAFLRSLQGRESVDMLVRPVAERHSEESTKHSGGCCSLQ